MKTEVEQLAEKFIVQMVQEDVDFLSISEVLNLINEDEIEAVYDKVKEARIIVKFGR